jgi:hypothetical protein
VQGPTRVTTEINQALDEVGDHLRAAQRASDDAQQDEARARQPGQRVAGSVSPLRPAGLYLNLKSGSRLL